MSDALHQLQDALSDRYRVARELGRGGMAVVYLADDLKHGRQVALKVLHPEAAAAIGPESFLREIEIVARLTHPHILPLFDSGAASGRLYYVTPYIPGGSLRQKLEREPQLAVEEALRLAREIASALGHAHQQGLVHRDVKPENVLLSDGIALVADFGIARAMGAGRGREETVVATALGTPAYMAPEQAMGRGEVDGRADLYALGCLLYEMLAGQPPFTGPPESLVHQHLSVAPRPVTDLRPTAPRALAEVIARTLAKLPSDRYATASSLAEALVAAGAGASAPTPAPRARTGTVPGNLPRPRTRFIGRQGELAEGARVLGDGRLLTITGVGGCGKSRLALRLAETLAESFPDGVWYADLALVEDPQRVAPTLAAALEVREEPGTRLTDTLAARLREQRMLLVLDNCDRVLGAAAELVDTLTTVGEVAVIATSREPLGVGGERVFPLRTLPMPPAGAATRQQAESSDAVKLFVDRARIVDSGFHLTDRTAPVVAEICRRLDGLPLAIALAAARVKVLRVEDIAARLDDRFRLLTGGSRTALPHHQTLQATLRWSYDQLTAEEQRLFRRLSVFAGGWTLAAATRVATEHADEFELLELVARLVDKSLVTMDRETEGESRYAMLETVRQYALERLEELGEAAETRARHLSCFVDLVEEAEPHLLGEAQAAWSARLLRELENLLAAHAGCDRTPGGAESGLRLVGALRRFWLFCGLLELGRRVTREALVRPGAQARTPPRAKALHVASNLAYHVGAYEESRSFAEDSLALASELNESGQECDALWTLGMACYALQDVACARLHLESLVGCTRQRGDARRLSVGLNGLAELLRAEGDLDAALPLYEEALRLFRETGDQENVVIANINLVAVAVARGELERARSCFLDCLALNAPLSPQIVGNLLDLLSAISALRGDWARTARWRGAADAQLESIGFRRDPADERFLAPLVGRARAALGEREFAAAAGQGRALDPHAALAEAPAWLEESPSAA